VNKVTHLRLKLLLTLLMVGVLAVMWVLQTGCPLYRVTGIPCPGCGMTRAWVLAARLDFATAFALHPMFWAMPILYGFFLFDFQPFRAKWLNWVILLAIGLGFAVAYAVRLINILF